MELITAKNGLRIALQPNNTARSVAINLYILCGSRNETEKNVGSAHFLEHMIFKGTGEIGLQELNRRFDKMGGHFNAYTSKEHTCIYCQVLESDAPEALSLMLKIVNNPALSTEDLEIEKGVILEEINMYEDSPEDLAAESLCSLIYKSDPLGRPVIGNKKSVAGITAGGLKKYRQKYYSPQRMVLSVCGKFQKDALLSVVETEFSSATEAEPLIPNHPPIPFNGGIVLKEKDFEQTQLMIASCGFPAGSDKRYAAAVFSAIAGGNASSRLNMRIREELGLAYSVYSCTYSYVGSGFFMVSAGTAHQEQERVLQEILKIMNNIKSTLTATEVEDVKSQFKATTVMGGESLAAMASSMGKEVLYSGKYTDIDKVAEKIDAVTLTDVIEISEQLWNKEKLALSVVGKPKTKEEYQSIM